jgi:integrase
MGRFVECGMSAVTPHSSAVSHLGSGGPRVPVFDATDPDGQAEIRRLAREVLELRMARVAPGTLAQTLVALGRYACSRLPDDAHAPIAPPHMTPWLPEGRLRHLLDGRDPSAATMSAIYRAHDDRFPDGLFTALVPEDFVVAMVVMITDGPRRATRRIEALLLDLFHDEAFRPPRGRRSQRGRAAQTLKHARLQLRSLQLLLAWLYEEYNDIQRPAPLRPWRTAGRPPEPPLGAVGAREDAPTPSVEVVRAVLEHLDGRVARPFMRRYGLTDLELVERDDAEQLDAPRDWLRRQGIVGTARDRAMLAVIATLGTRAAAIRALDVSDFTADYRLPASIDGFVPARLGALRIRGLKGHPDRVKVLPEAATVRVETWLWIYRRCLRNNGMTLTAGDPLFPGRRLTAAGRPVRPERYSRGAFHNRFTGHAAGARKTSTIALVPQNPLAVGKTARQLALQGIDPEREEIWRGAGPHGVRRFADRCVYDHADRYFQANPDLRRVSAMALKEALLDHANIGDDPLGYTGLADQDARRNLTCIASHVIADAIWSDLALRRGPDERHLREAYLVIKGLQQHLFGAEDQLRRHDDRISVLPQDASLSIREVHARDVLTDRVSTLRYDIASWQQRAAELEHERNWIALPAGQQRVDPKHLRSTILDEPDPPERVRDWVTGVELRRLFGRSAETIRRWSDPATSDRSRPWPSRAAPIVELDQRTRLYWIPGFRPEMLNDPDIQHELHELLRRWPTGSEWSLTGSKRRRLNHQGDEGGLRLPQGVHARSDEYALPHDVTRYICEAA